MRTKTFVKRFCAIIVAIFIQTLLFAQTQYDYYDDDAVVGGADRALNGIIIFVGLIILVVVILFILGISAKIYYWFNPDADPEYKKAKATKEKEASIKGVSVKDFMTTKETIFPLVNGNNYNKTEVIANDTKVKLSIKPLRILNEDEIKRMINPTKEERQNSKGDPECNFGFPSYTSDYKQFLSLDLFYGLDDPQNPNRTIKILDGTEAICSNAITSNCLEHIDLPNSLICIGNNSINCKALKEILLPDSLQYIGDSAFYNCEKLQELIIPENVKHIGTFAFSNTGIRQIISYSPKFKVISGCLFDENLKRLIKYFGQEKNIVIPQSVIDITGAFTGCHEIEKVTLSSCTTIIGDRTFMNCTRLKEISIPKGIVEIGYCAFDGCKSLERIIIPEGVRVIKGMCFEDCQNLRYVVLPGSIEEIGDKEYGDYDIFRGCISLDKIFIPQGTKDYFLRFFSETLLEEGSPAEYYEKKRAHGTNVTKINLDTTVSEQDIRDGWSDEQGVRYSFDGKRLLYSSRREGNSLYVSGIKKYTIRSGTVVICDNAFESGALESIELPDSIEKIGDSVFSGCKNLRQINIPSRVSHFGKRVFDGCSSLKNITIPVSLEVIKEYTFNECASLKNVTIPKNIKEIRDHAFYGCSSLNELVIPEGVILLGDNALGACKRLKEITLPQSIREIGGNPFGASILSGKHTSVICNSSQYVVKNEGLYTADMKTLIACLTNQNTFDVADSVTTIGNGAFNWSRKLTTIKLPSKLVEIGKNAFWGCDFSRINIPDSVKSIGEFAFSNCQELTKLLLPNGLESLGNRAFWDCKRITELVLPKSLKKIEEETFSGCESLKSITILNPDIIIDERAFYYTEAIERVEFSGCPSNLSDELFYGLENLKEIIVPRGTKQKFCSLIPSRREIIKIANRATNQRCPSDAELATNITDNDRIDSWKDDCEVIYSKDGKKLLTCEYKESVNDPFEDEYGNKLVLLNNRIVDYNNFDVFMNRLENQFYYEIKSGTNVICDNAFSHCENLSLIRIPESVKAIGCRAFEGCKTMSKFVFPSEIKAIKEYCFIACRDLESVILSDELTTIEKGAFFGCESLRRIQFPASLKTIGESAFACSSLEELLLPEGLQEIGAKAFLDTRIKTIVIPASVRSIGCNAFAGCTQLQSVEIRSTNTVLDSTAFQTIMTSLDSFIVPQGAKSYFASKFPAYFDIIVEK